VIPTGITYYNNQISYKPNLDSRSIKRRSEELANQSPKTKIASVVGEEAFGFDITNNSPLARDNGNSAGKQDSAFTSAMKNRH
jgi:hypothetical protein